MIRTATTDDGAFIDELAHEFDPYGTQYVAVFNAMLNGNRGGLPPHVQGQLFQFLIAEEKGGSKPLGFVAVGWPMPKQPPNGARGEIHGIVTGVEFRRQGVANSLMKHVMQQAGERSVRRLECITDQNDNPAALAFFTQRGFVNLGHAGNYPNGQRAVRLRLEIV